MTATLSNHQEIAGFMKCSMEHTGGPGPVTLDEYVKMGDTVSFFSYICYLLLLSFSLVVEKYFVRMYYIFIRMLIKLKNHVDGFAITRS